MEREGDASTPNGSVYQLLIKRLLFSPVVYAPDQEIVYRDLRRFTYRELRERIAQLAGGLAALGVGLGDTVAMMDWDSHRYLECFFAIPMIGATLQTVNVRLSLEQILYTLNHARPKIVLVNSEFLPLIEAMKSRLESVEAFVLLHDGPDRPESAIAFAAEYEPMLAAQSPDFAFPDFDEHTRATTFYTTGTTGLPKAVYFSHRQLVLHTLATLATYGTSVNHGRLHQGDVYMPVTPMFHVHAWGVPYAATALGVKQVYPGRYAPELLLALKRKEAVTFSHAVPTILHLLLTHPASENTDMRGWKFVIGGSALPRGLAVEAMRRGIDVFCGYGMSETGPLSTLAHLPPGMPVGGDEEIETRISAGRPTVLVEVRTVDEAMNDVPRDGVSRGEIVLRSPWLTQGYVGSPAASRDLWEGGYLHTGDLGVIGKDGYLRIVDRVKDVIKSGGEWVSSLEVESVISRLPAVSEVAVIGVPHEKWGERPIALVVLKSTAPALSEEDIRAYLIDLAAAQTFPKLGVPDRIVFVETLPKTSVGKLDKKAMRAIYGGAHQIDRPPSTTI